MVKVQKTNLLVLLIIVGIITVAGGYFFINSKVKNNESSVSTNTQSNQSDSATPNGSRTSSTEERLIYLIEEEKMAHDVYMVMYQKYGANVFGNILESENTHQSRVLTLLQARNLPDPRSNELGVFANKELQNLYNQLIEQGNRSATEAYKAGIIIEEKDIADISAQLATATDQDIIETLEALRRASENHLRAFNRQLK